MDSCIINKISDVDFYLRKNAGLYVYQRINDAEKSIKIISPYMSIPQIKQLVDKKNQGIDIKVITTDDTNTISQDKLKELIIQKSFTLENNKEARTILLIFLILLLFVGILVLIRAISMNDNFFKLITENWFLFVLYFVIFFICRLLHKNIRIFQYSYHTIFPMLFAKSARSKDGIYTGLFFHSKLFIIDEKIAYAGSLNFSESGMKYNYETRIAIKDKETVMKLSQHFDYLFEKFPIGMPKSR
jgi:phosphatidylserine/phosphatidylglycerophosphate/cardiolipin synthase-like enzyme